MSAPSWCVKSFPDSKIRTVGRPYTLYFSVVFGFASTSTLTTFSFPSYVCKKGACDHNKVGKA